MLYPSFLFYQVKNSNELYKYQERFFNKDTSSECLYWIIISLKMLKQQI